MRHESTALPCIDQGPLIFGANIRCRPMTNPWNSRQASVPKRHRFPLHDSLYSTLSLHSNHNMKASTRAIRHCLALAKSQTIDPHIALSKWRTNCDGFSSSILPAVAEAIFPLADDLHGLLLLSANICVSNSGCEIDWPY